MSQREDPPRRGPDDDTPLEGAPAFDALDASLGGRRDTVKLGSTPDSPAPDHAYDYVAPTAIPKRAPQRTFEMDTVKVSPEADPRRMATMRKLRAPAAPEPSAQAEPRAQPLPARRPRPAGWLVGTVMVLALGLCVAALVVWSGRGSQTEPEPSLGTLDLDAPAAPTAPAVAAPPQPKARVQAPAPSEPPAPTASVRAPEPPAPAAVAAPIGPAPSVPKSAKPKNKPESEPQPIFD